LQNNLLVILIVIRYFRQTRKTGDFACTQTRTGLRVRKSAHLHGFSGARVPVAFPSANSFRDMTVVPNLHYGALRP